MDKEGLYKYFNANYLSRQEVLFKLPFSVSIDSFWPELVGRRKAIATTLPLYSATGTPYWYVLTEKMIAASERLCEEAMHQDTDFDPYRAPMTSAMTEEMFFTSFVEGAQIPLREAMDFLQRGTEPENVQEQMIWNNRQAWSAMVKALYRPLDEPFVKSLVFMLTDEMDGRAEDYRQTDIHPIAAMNNEPFEVPPAYLLPDRMREYYAFLQKPDVHPLIKASVGQGYLLVCRPFPEGNERLSRMISAAVLLRSGYDFFRDISLSNHIARESYRYYKAMCEIIRTENGCDLTYFIEYYLDLLVRALDAKKEHDRKRERELLEHEQEAISRERELAIQPLRAAVQASARGDTETLDAEQRAAEVSNQLYAESDEPAAEITADDAEVRRFYETLNRISLLGRGRVKRVVKQLKQFIADGIVSFTCLEWQKATNISRGFALDDCYYMKRMGLTTSNANVTPMEYSLAYIHKNAHDTDIPVKANRYDAMKSHLRTLLKSTNSRERDVARILLDMLGKGISQFKRNDWAERTTVCNSVMHDRLRMAVNLGLIRKEADTYIICRSVDPTMRFTIDNPNQNDMVNKLVMHFKNKPFTNADASAYLGIKPANAPYFIEQLIQRNILSVEYLHGGPMRFTFTDEYMQFRRRSAPATTAVSSPAEYRSGIAAAGRNVASMQV